MLPGNAAVLRRMRDITAVRRQFSLDVTDRKLFQDLLLRFGVWEMQQFRGDR